MRYLIKYRRGPKDLPRISLTLDDGPSLWTDEILDILQKHSIKATFFLIPDNMRKLPAVVKRIIDEGHEIGGHAHQDEIFSKWKSFWQKASDEKVKNSLNTIYDMLGVYPHFFRPSPELAFNMGTDKILKQLDLIPILASAYSRVNRSQEAQIKEIAEKLRNGAIILLHDGHDLKIDSERPKDTIAILPSIIKAARAKGLEFVKISELFGMPAYREGKI